METTFWIEKGWGDSVDHASFKDIEITIEETIEMDAEHAAFWAGNVEDEVILEVHRGFKVYFIEEEDQKKSIVKTVKNWIEVKQLFRLFFNKEYERLRDEFKAD